MHVRWEFQPHSRQWICVKKKKVRKDLCERWYSFIVMPLFAAVGDT
jgi:hypothetical protein